MGERRLLAATALLKKYNNNPNVNHAHITRSRFEELDCCSFGAHEKSATRKHPLVGV